ncbi:MAG: hypothetical protein RLZZ502_500 [Pseudomonadota bacterium]|jgi:Co/Zn/Cd efflux system component
MSAHHDHGFSHSQVTSPRYRRVLWVALLLNFAMFFVEIIGGLRSGSVSLFADSLDFAADAANYGLSLAVLSMGALWQTRAAQIKALTMMVFGLLILLKTFWSIKLGAPPESVTMGAIAVLAFVVNFAVAFMLYAFREGNANMRSVWLCSRNDAIGNVAVLLAAVGVFGTHTIWPDILVAVGMAGLALHSGWAVWRQAGREMHTAACGEHAH